MNHNKTYKILVVDDDRNARKIFCKILDRLDYEYRDVDNGEEALRLVRGSDIFDLAVIDQNFRPNPKHFSYPFNSIEPSLAARAISYSAGPVTTTISTAAAAEGCCFSAHWTVWGLLLEAKCRELGQFRSLGS